jgi:hypothetical protein
MEDLLPELAIETGIETIRVETALSRFPIHSLTGGEVEINIRNLGTATKWEVAHSSKYGQPGQLAYKIDTLVINRRIEEQTRPIPKIIRLGSLREIASEVSTAGKRGANPDLIKQALLQNTFAGISAKISFKTKEGSIREIEFADTRYAVVFTGEKFPDGRKADSVYLILHDIYRDILNSAQTRPLDYSYMKALPPMAQRFYEIISYVIYAALHHRNKTCKLRYSEFSKLSTATRYFTFDQVKKQMYKIHLPHIENGYIERSITYQPTTDENDKPDWWIFYEPGQNAGKQYEEYLQTPKRRIIATEVPPGQKVFSFIEDVPAIPEKQEKKAEPATKPEEKTIPSPEVRALCEDLVRAGVSRGVALTLAVTHPDECRRQLEYLPYAEIKSTPGAYLATAINRGFAPPKAFQEIAEKRAEEDRRKKAAEVKAARERAEAIRHQAETALLDSEILALESEAPEQHAAFQKYIEAEKAQAINKPFLKLGSRASQIVAQSFETPEKRHELFKAWRASQAT